LATAKKISILGVSSYQDTNRKTDILVTVLTMMYFQFVAGLSNKEIGKWNHLSIMQLFLTLWIAARPKRDLNP